MDIVRAKEIIATLAEGVDPTTGEVLPDNSVCNKGEIVRAFYAVLIHLDEKKSKKNMPANAGKPWTADMKKNFVICMSKECLPANCVITFSELERVLLRA